jgi:hypothetical protein
MEGLQVQ